MIGISITIQGIEQIVAKYSGGADRIVKAVTRDVGETVREQIARYPGPVHKPIIWASTKQRAWYFANRRGMGPYVRQSDSWSQRLGPSWATENRGLGAVVGTRVTYAPWVQSAEKQTKQMAATGWVTDEQAVERANVQGAAERALSDVLKEW